MDYLEGLLLGTLWSDTDFENRRHYMLFILYGLFVDLVFLINYILGKDITGLNISPTIQTVLLIVLVLACPFICFRYYRMPLWGKAFVLIEKLLKALIVVNLTIKYLSPLIRIESDNIQDNLINYLNGTLETYTQKFASEAGSFATVMGVLTGGIHVVLSFVLILVASIVIPGIVFLLIRYIQYGYDYIINSLILKKYFRYRK